MFEDSWQWLAYQAAAEKMEGWGSYASITKRRERIGRSLSPVPRLGDTSPIPAQPVQARGARRSRRLHWSAEFQLAFAPWLRGTSDADLSPVLGYSREQARRHIERQFTGKMSWENYGPVWVVDHIIPKIRFDRDEIQAAYALTNLRPLCRYENRRKGARRTHLV
jgi:hypothetical protein